MDVLGECPRYKSYDILTEKKVTKAKKPLTPSSLARLLIGYCGTCARYVSYFVNKNDDAFPQNENSGQGEVTDIF